MFGFESQTGVTTSCSFLIIVKNKKKIKNPTFFINFIPIEDMLDFPNLSKKKSISDQ